jgi:hypothetical protein
MTILSQQARTDIAPASRIAKWAPLAVVLSGTFVFVLDFFVANAALPDIARSLRASTAAIVRLVSGPRPAAGDPGDRSGGRGARGPRG